MLNRWRSLELTLRCIHSWYHFQKEIIEVKKKKQSIKSQPASNGCQKIRNSIHAYFLRKKLLKKRVKLKKLWNFYYFLVFGVFCCRVCPYENNFPTSKLFSRLFSNLTRRKEIISSRSYLKFFLGWERFSFGGLLDGDVFAGNQYSKRLTQGWWKIVQFCCRWPYQDLKLSFYVWEKFCMY